MTRNVVALTTNDLAVAFKNKTVYLMVFIPLFVFFTLSVVDRPDARVAISKLGFIQNQTYASGILQNVQRSGRLFSVSWFGSETEARKALLDKRIDGLLLPDIADPNAAELLVAKKETIQALTIVESVSRLQRAAEARDTPNWISHIKALSEDKGVQNQTLPIWILMLVLLVGFLVLPPQVAEEKEKKLILGLLQTPARESEWLIAKILTGMILSIVSIAFLHLVSGFGARHAASYLALLVIGSFCFSSMGLLLGFLCRSQASARALGVVFYLPHLLPSALSDFSKALSAVAVFVPSYQFYVPVKAILLEDATTAGFTLSLISLTAIGFACCAAAAVLLGKRWLM